MSDRPINFNGLDSTVHGPVRLGFDGAANGWLA